MTDFADNVVRFLPKHDALPGGGSARYRRVFSVNRAPGIIAAHDYLMRRELAAERRLKAVLTWGFLSLIAFCAGVFLAAALHKADADLRLFYQLEALDA